MKGVGNWYWGITKYPKTFKRQEQLEKQGLSLDFGFIKDSKIWRVQQK